MTQPQRGSVVCTTAHPEGGFPLELGLLFSNACCGNGCKYQSGQQAMLPHQQGGPTRENDGIDIPERPKYGKQGIPGRKEHE